MIFITIRGRVEHFNPETLWGELSTEDHPNLRFHASTFVASPRRIPETGEMVLIVFSESSNRPLLVRAEKQAPMVRLER